ncbi:hypothetical protein [Brevibacterium samyangense]|uniref:hypothetical protein n=1 Tax=Brevibacterium samyangense TaxID=366888 RepID=UPI0031DDB711
MTCKTCGKTTWAGCGQHIADVKATVPAGQWCPGHQKEQRGSSTGGFFSRLLGH